MGLPGDAERLAVLETKVDEHGRRLDTGELQMAKLDTKIDKMIWFQMGTLVSALGGLLMIVFDHFSRAAH